jgi:hypothetical protein
MLYIFFLIITFNPGMTAIFNAISANRARARKDEIDLWVALL